MRQDGTFLGVLRRIGECGRLMVGVPDYSTYLDHMQNKHAGTTPMNEAEFVRNRQSARFGEGGRGGFRCC